MQIGVTFPQLEIGADPGKIREYAQAAESLGFKHLVAFDHVLGAVHERPDLQMKGWPKGAYDEKDQFHEPFTLFGFLAGLTHTIEFVTGILVLPQRQTALVAKQAAEIDLLSEGRLRLGVGLGWNQFEYEALGVPWERRGPRMSEQIHILRALWGEPVVSYEGEFHLLSEVGIQPRPSRQIPLWIGANSPPALRRAARHAAGVIAALGGAHPALETWGRAVRKALDQTGRDPASFSIEGRIDLFGRKPADLAGEIARWSQLGATHLSLNSMTPPRLRGQPSSVDQHLEMLDKFRDLHLS